MSRTVAAQDRNNESFAGLMEHLTKRAPRDVSERKPNAATGSGFASSPAKRPVLAVTEIRQAKPRPRSEEQELSYEQALRLHGRRRLSEENDFDPPIPQAAAKTASAATASRSAAARTTPPPNTRQSASRTQRQPQAAARQEAATQNKSRQNRNPSESATTAQFTSPTPRMSRPAGPVHKRAAHPTAAPDIKVRRPAANASKISASTKKQRSASAQTQARAMATLNETKAAIAALECEPETRPRTLQLEHASGNRRSIISVRLNEEEFARLRTRANESGISVSAYMRSCVLDAEHLRAQVKQALAEMRAYSRPADSSQLSALARTVQSTAENTGMWSRMIARSTTFFMGLWYPFRRSG